MEHDIILYLYIHYIVRAVPVCAVSLSRNDYYSVVLRLHGYDDYQFTTTTIGTRLSYLYVYTYTLVLVD